MRAHAERLGYYHAFSSMGTDTPGVLADRLIELAPAGMSKVFFGCTGSDANDTQVKLVWFYNNVLGRPEKKKIIARKSRLPRRQRHGRRADRPAGPPRQLRPAAADDPAHDRSASPLGGGAGDDATRQFAQKLADDLEALILAEGPETVAAFIAEPVMGAGGVLVPPDTYFERIQAVLRRYDVLLIADEVITAFGRLGHWFGSDVFGIEPDLITVAKGLTSGYFPLSGCIVSDRVWRVLVDGSAGAPVRPRLHLLRPPARRRRRAGEPRPDRERGAARPCTGARRADADAPPRGVRRAPDRRRGARARR